MGKTLEELMSDIGLSVPEKGQEKVASAAPTSNEVNSVLENLGLSGAFENEEVGQTKQASSKGASMGLADIYANMFESEEQEEQGQEGQQKVASEQGEGQEDAGDVSEAFGEMVGAYFETAKEAFFDKIAGDLEAEAGAGHKVPQGSVAQLPVNEELGGEKAPRKALQTSGSKSPYAGGKGDVIGAKIKAILSRATDAANVAQTSR